MHPLFTAHLIADFLLQPTRLVQWKERHWTGAVVHAAVHVIVMALFLLPDQLYSVAVILLVGLLHGLIDRAKIAYQRRNKREFSKPFLIDQLCHLVVLVAAALLYDQTTPLWRAKYFQGISLLLITVSFGIGVLHLMKNATRGKAVSHAILLAAVFTTFIIAALVF